MRSATFSLSAQLSHNGNKYRASASVPGATAYSSEATLSVSGDVIAPVLLTAKSGPALFNVTLGFNELLKASSTVDAFSYTIQGGDPVLTVLSAAIQPDGKSVVLTLDGSLSAGRSYSVKVEFVEDLAGLAQKQPVIAALFTVFLLSLIGVPLTSGFFGKFYIFKAAIDSKLFWLSVLGLLNSAVAAYYYLRVIVVMYFHEPGQSVETATAPSAGINITLWASAIAIVVLGVFPSLLLNFATQSAYLGK